MDWSIWWRKIRGIFGWDLAVALVAGGTVWLIAPNSVPNDFAKDIYGLGASVLAIVFSVFFAALAIIMSADGDDFVELLEERGTLDVVLFHFRFTLWLLFLGLCASVVLYAITSWWSISGDHAQSRILTSTFVGLLLWGVSATLESALSSVTHSQLHVKYMQLSDEEKKWISKQSGSDNE